MQTTFMFSHFRELLSLGNVRTSAASQVRVHADPVSDELVGDGLAGGDTEGGAGPSEYGLNHLIKKKIIRFIS